MLLTVHLNFTPGGGAFYAVLFLLLVLGFAVLVWYLSGRRKRRIRKILRDEVPVSAQEFEENWITGRDRREPDGYKYHEFPGCYVILFYDVKPEVEDVYVKLIPCEREGLNDLERALIDEYGATESYNATAGGGTDWEAKDDREAERSVTRRGLWRR